MNKNKIQQIFEINNNKSPKQIASKNKVRVILIILLLIMFAIIFDFSNQDGEKSGGMSRELTEEITQNIETIQNMEEEEKEETLLIIEHMLRKLAHFSLYTIVGILLILLFNTYELSNKKRIIYSLIIGIAYASTDEIHQSFIPDRAPLFTDVIIDTAGVFFGTLIVRVPQIFEAKHHKCLQQNTTNL